MVIVFSTEDSISILTVKLTKCYLLNYLVSHKYHLSCNRIPTLQFYFSPNSCWRYFCSPIPTVMKPCFSCKNSISTRKLYPKVVCFSFSFLKQVQIVCVIHFLFLKYPFTSTSHVPNILLA